MLPLKVFALFVDECRKTGYSGYLQHVHPGGHYNKAKAEKAEIAETTVVQSSPEGLYVTLTDGSVALLTFAPSVDVIPVVEQQARVQDVLAELFKGDRSSWVGSSTARYDLSRDEVFSQEYTDISLGSRVRLQRPDFMPGNSLFTVLWSDRKVLSEDEVDSWKVLHGAIQVAAPPKTRMSPALAAVLMMAGGLSNVR